jgi:hypothetical protein
MLRKEKLSIAANLKKLASKKSISLMDLSVKKALVVQAISPITYPSAPTILNAWPDLTTPERYLISKSYLPNNVIAFQNRQTKKICSLGSSYFKNIKKYQAAKKRSKTLSRAVKDAQTNLSGLSSQYRQANSYYLEKKRVYKREKKLRLKRPDDSLFIRAKNRYLEAKAALKGAKSSLQYGRLNLEDAVSVYRGNQSQIKSYLKRSRQVRASQRQLINKTELYSKAERTCSNLIL